MSEPVSNEEALAIFIRFADQMQDVYRQRNRPAYEERCPCGGSVEVAIEVPPAERRKIREHFQWRHRECARQSSELLAVLGQIGGEQP